MKLSTTTDAMSCLYGDEEAMRRLAAYGFDAVDYSMFIYPNDGAMLKDEARFLRHIERVKRAADASGISTGQVHSPMAGYPNTPEAMAEYVRLSKLALKAAGILESPYVVVHPIIWPEYRYTHGRAENKVMNMEFYPKLIETAQANDTKVAIENMFNWDPIEKHICPTVVSTAEEMAEYVDNLNAVAGEERFVNCLDVGHPTLVGFKPEEMVPVLGKRLQVLHVQDTDGVDDLHTLPYYGGAVNWDAFCLALRENDYPGTFSFEADGFLKGHVPASCQDEGEKYMQAVGRSLIAKITK